MRDSVHSNLLRSLKGYRFMGCWCFGCALLFAGLCIGFYTGVIVIEHEVGNLLGNILLLLTMLEIVIAYFFGKVLPGRFEEASRFVKKTTAKPARIERLRIQSASKQQSFSLIADINVAGKSITIRALNPSDQAMEDLSKINVSEYKDKETDAYFERHSARPSAIKVADHLLFTERLIRPLSQ